MASTAGTEAKSVVDQANGLAQARAERESEEEEEEEQEQEEIGVGDGSSSEDGVDDGEQYR